MKDLEKMSKDLLQALYGYIQPQYPYAEYLYPPTTDKVEYKRISLLNEKIRNENRIEMEKFDALKVRIKKLIDEK